jgi:peptidoglycan/LPS O-acetylase OafA/YrhL
METIVSNSTSLLFFRTAAILLIIGMLFGIYMSASGNHAATGAHAHLNLIGFVVMSIYGVFFALNPQKSAGRLPKVLWGLNTVAAVVMFPALVLLLNGYPAFEPVVAAASFLALGGAILFAVLLFLPTPR